jgi:hypothetical protein
LYLFSLVLVLQLLLDPIMWRMRTKMSKASNKEASRAYQGVVEVGVVLFVIGVVIVGLIGSPALVIGAVTVRFSVAVGASVPVTPSVAVRLSVIVGATTSVIISTPVMGAVVVTASASVRISLAVTPVVMVGATVPVIESVAVMTAVGVGAGLGAGSVGMGDKQPLSAASRSMATIITRNVERSAEFICSSTSWLNDDSFGIAGMRRDVK